MYRKHGLPSDSEVLWTSSDFWAAVNFATNQTTKFHFSQEECWDTRRSRSLRCTLRTAASHEYEHNELQKFRSWERHFPSHDSHRFLKIPTRLERIRKAETKIWIFELIDLKKKGEKNWSTKSQKSARRAGGGHIRSKIRLFSLLPPHAAHEQCHTATCPPRCQLRVEYIEVLATEWKDFSIFWQFLPKIWHFFIFWKILINYSQVFHFLPIIRIIRE
jgi:hypothetical protein